MGKGHRQERLGGEIQKIISTLLIRELKDPRLQNAMVSVTAVDVTNDGSYATVYLTVLGYGQQTPEKKQKQEHLNDGVRSIQLHLPNQEWILIIFPDWSSFDISRQCFCP